MEDHLKVASFSLIRLGDKLDQPKTKTANKKKHIKRVSVVRLVPRCPDQGHYYSPEKQRMFLSTVGAQAKRVPLLKKKQVLTLNQRSSSRERTENISQYIRRPEPIGQYLLNRWETTDILQYTKLPTETPSTSQTTHTSESQIHTPLCTPTVPLFPSHSTQDTIKLT